MKTLLKRCRSAIKTLLENVDGGPVDLELELLDDLDAVIAQQAEPVASLESVPFLIHYDDADVRPEIVIGEASARARFTRVSDNWNAHLFVKIASNVRGDAKYDHNAVLGASQPTAAEPAPIDMVLYCPKCHFQHIDAPEIQPGRLVSGGPNAGRAYPPIETWSNPPHRSHLCHGCKHIWRPADVPTNGVAAIKTRGRNDSWE